MSDTSDKKNDTPDFPVDSKTIEDTAESKEAGLSEIGPAPSEPVEEPEPIAVEQTQAANAPGSEAKASSLPLIGVGILALVVIGLGYFGWREHSALQSRFAALETVTSQTGERFDDLDSALSTVQQKLPALENRVSKNLQSTLSQQFSEELQSQSSKLDAAMAEQLASIEELKVRMTAYQNRLSALSTTTREDWKLAEAEYLLRLANQRVLLENNPVNAIALLEAADAIIEETAAGLGDPELFAIRRSLADELTALKLIAPVDRDGLYLSLQSLAEQVDALPLERESLLASEKSAAPESDEAAATQDDSWGAKAWRQVKSMAGALSQYIRIETDNEELNPLLTQQAAQLAQLNVRILLQQAQVALLKEQPDAYKSSLDRAIEQVASTFPDSKQATQYIDSLSDLAAQDIKPTLPDLSGSLRALVGYIEQLHRQAKASS